MLLGKHWCCSILLVVALVLYVAVYLHFYYYGGVKIKRLCFVQHSMIGVMLNLLLILHFILSCSYPDLVIVWNLQCLCGHCNGAICVTTNFGRINPHLSLTIEIVATVFFMHMVTVDIACKNIEILEYMMKLCNAVVHRIIQGKKLMAV